MPPSNFHDVSLSIGVDYSFPFMRADGRQLEQIAGLIDDGALRPVVDKILPFSQTPEALADVETGRAKGKVVIQVQSGDAADFADAFRRPNKERLTTAKLTKGCIFLMQPIGCTL